MPLFKRKSKTRDLTAPLTPEQIQERDRDAEELRQYREEIANKLSLSEYENRALKLKLESLEKYYCESRKVLQNTILAGGGYNCLDELIEFYENSQIQGL